MNGYIYIHLNNIYHKTSIESMGKHSNSDQIAKQGESGTILIRTNDRYKEEQRERLLSDRPLGTDKVMPNRYSWL